MYDKHGYSITLGDFARIDFPEYATVGIVTDMKNVFISIQLADGSFRFAHRYRVTPLTPEQAAIWLLEN